MPERQVRVGVVGAGVMGADHAHRLATRVAGAELVAVADPDPARLESLLSELTELAGYGAAGVGGAGSADAGLGAAGLGDTGLDTGGIRAFDDPLALLDSDLDAVILASPGAAHPDQLARCLARGLPVLCEKPLTMDAESSAWVVRAEQAHLAAGGGRLIHVGFMRRFDPEFMAAKRLIDAGELGRVLVLHQVHRNKAAQNPGFASEMIVRDSLVHEADMARHLTGDEIATIQVHTPRASSAAPAGVADPQVAIFTMRGGAIVTNEVFVNSQTGYEVRCEVVGERGSVVIGRPDTGLYSTGLVGTGLVGAGRAGSDGADDGNGASGVGRWGGIIDEDYRTRFALAYDREVQVWVDAVRRGGSRRPTAGSTASPGTGPAATAADGHAATAVAEAGMESLRSGLPVAVRVGDPV